MMMFMGVIVMTNHRSCFGMGQGGSERKNRTKKKRRRGQVLMITVGNGVRI